MSLFYTQQQPQQPSPMNMSPYTVANHQQVLSFGPATNNVTSPSETTGYLPGYLLGGPNSPSVRTAQSPSLQKTVSFGTQRHSVVPSTPPVTTLRPGTQGSTTGTHLLFSGDRKVDTKPGGPPVESIHEHSSSPARTYAPLIADSPERRQLTFTGLRTVHQATPSYSTGAPTPGMSGGSYTVSNSVSTSPPQMDPFYSQGESLTYDDSFNEHWVTVFGFPAAATSFILEQFSQYGTILKHELKEGNWIHLQYQTKLQAKKALSKNGKIFGEGMMIGVQPCIDKSVLNKYPPSSTPVLSGNDSINRIRPSTMRPLNAAYQASTASHDVAPVNPNTPQKSTGFISKAMEYVFGW